MVQKILSDDRKDQFWQKIEDVLINIPPSKGTDMVYLKQKYKKEKIRKRKAF